MECRDILIAIRRLSFFETSAWTSEFTEFKLVSGCTNATRVHMLTVWPSCQNIFKLIGWSSCVCDPFFGSDYFSLSKSWGIRSYWWQRWKQLGAEVLMTGNKVSCILPSLILSAHLKICSSEIMKALGWFALNLFCFKYKQDSVSDYTCD